jgi:hypothetical protein
MSSSTKLTCEGTGVYLSEAQNPIPPPPLKRCIRVYKYTYSHREGGEGES